MFPVLIAPESDIRRSEFQHWMETRGVDTQMVWTGNVTRQPAFHDTLHRTPGAGLPHADRVMEWGVILPNSDAMTDEDCDYIGECVDAFLAERGLA